MNTKLVNRFLNYVKVDTQSSTSSDTFPSTQTQIDFAHTLAKECESLGLLDVSVDEHGYVMATLPGNIDSNIPIVGFIAHMDTAPDYSGKDVNPQLIENYNGEDLLLNAEQNIIMSPKQFPVLKTLVGETLITTDGTTLLGGDDKAGIAEIMTAIEYLIEHPEIPHGTIRIGFTPDEEIGKGVDFFDVKRFNADFAYTIDGGTVGEVQYDNFNAASAHVTVNGVSVHPGAAKNKLKNSITIGCEFNSLMPALEVPEHTDGFEGFYHLHDMSCSIEKTVLSYIIRDHSKEKFLERKAKIQSVADHINHKYGKNTASVTITDSYFNMKEVVENHPKIMAIANQALKNIGLEPQNEPIRGGTDGARLSFMGLPCPNIFTGSYNYHGRYEFTVVAHMDLATRAIIEIAQLVAK